MTNFVIHLDNTRLNDYQIGRINGIIWALTGMPEHRYPIRMSTDKTVCQMTFETDADGMYAVQKAINKLYPDVFVSDYDLI